MKSKQQVNWMDKLIPSNKNPLIQSKLKSLSTLPNIPTEGMDPSFSIDTVSNVNNSTFDANLNKNKDETNESYQEKWKKIVRENKFNYAIETYPEKDSENSNLTFDEINELIEEKYKTAINDKFFLRNSFHSILPFIFIKSKEIHRMTLSDYEIKMICKSQVFNAKPQLECYDYYKIGIINFYKGKYTNAYSNFKKAYELLASSNSNDPNVTKWLCFSGLVIVFCTRFKNQVDFKLIRKEFNTEQVCENFFFNCCGIRNKSNSIKVNPINDPSNDFSSSLILNEVCEMIAQTVDDQNEVWWLHLLISCYAKLHPNNKQISSTHDLKFIINKIKEKDSYLSYLAYGEYNYIINENFAYDKLLLQLINSYPQRAEGYLRYWQLLIDKESKFKNFDKANSLSDFFWKNSSSIQFDEDYSINSLYFLICHAKSCSLIGNHLYSITYFQKEYPSNFMFPSIYYLFGKYSSKSRSKKLKNAAISSLKECTSLLFEDLQYAVKYWLGNIYYESGSYDLCYDQWKEFLDNKTKSFGWSEKKEKKIQQFMYRYINLNKAMSEFKINLTMCKKFNYSSPKLTKEQTKKKLFLFLSQIETLQTLEPNLKTNKNFIYDLFKAYCYFYIENNTNEALKILIKIIQNKKYFMEAHFLIWKVLRSLGNYKSLLLYSYYIIRISHLNEVSFQDWQKCYIYYSKALIFNGKFDDAINLLRNLLDVFANIPIEGIKYLSDIHKLNKISTTNIFVSLDSATEFYSKYRIYKKSLEIFDSNNVRKKRLYSSTGLTPMKLSLADEKFPSPTESCNLDLTITNADMVKVLEDYIESNLDFDIPTESPCN